MMPRYLLIVLPGTICIFQKENIGKIHMKNVIREKVSFFSNNIIYSV
jgi:hypothetical protein